MSASDEGESDGGAVPAVTGESPPRGDACCKVERVARAYGLEGIDVELRRRRVDEGATLHELADYVNERVTASAIAAGAVAIEAEPATVRAALQDAGTLPPERREDIRESLAGGLDVERLQTDFVSHETVRTHLNEHLDISTATGGFDSPEELERTLLAAQSQYVDSIEGALARAGERDLIEGRSFSVYRTRVECEDCSNTYRLETLLANGGCDCSSR